jgi:hypothetical protein
MWHILYFCLTAKPPFDATTLETPACVSLEQAFSGSQLSRYGSQPTVHQHLRAYNTGGGAPSTADTLHFLTG